MEVSQREKEDLPKPPKREKRVREKKVKTNKSNTDMLQMKNKVILELVHPNCPLLFPFKQRSIILPLPCSMLSVTYSLSPPSLPPLS